MATDPRSEYLARAARFAADRDAAHRVAGRLSHARLAAFAGAVAGGIWAEETGAPLAVALLLLAAFAFAVAVVVHGRYRERAARLGAFADLNEAGPDRLDRRWDAIPVLPPPEVMAAHPYADDLDIWGVASLVQLLGPTGTPAGRTHVAEWLLVPGPIEEVPRRQRAVAELATLPDVRDDVAAHARRAGTVTEEELAPLLRWAAGGAPPGPSQAARVLAWVVPAATWVAIGLDLTDVTDRAWWVFGLLAATAMTFAGPGARARSAFTRAFAREGIFTGFPDLLATIARASFRSPALQAIQAELAASGADPAARLAELDRLMHLSDLRRSGMMYLPVQLLTLRDLHVHAALERWRRSAGVHLAGWLDAAGAFEALCALGTLAHDQPGWTFPTFREEPLLEARSLGHPLLADVERVANDVVVGPPGTFLHVTGSNMSGKSTLLRAIGLNVVLARAGGPVCARELRMPPLTVRSSIRVRDSLARGVSYFMAELERLKTVVDAAGRERSPTRILFLLDEILHGTNTAERRIAARRVLHHLLDAGAIGAVTTHDLDLLDPALEDAAVSVHFRETVTAGEEAAMTFDYVLRPGVATSTNALALMRIVGLASERQPVEEGGTG